MGPRPCGSCRDGVDRHLRRRTRLAPGRPAGSGSRMAFARRAGSFRQDRWLTSRLRSRRPLVYALYLNNVPTQPTPAKQLSKPQTVDLRRDRGEPFRRRSDGPCCEGSLFAPGATAGWRKRPGREGLGQRASLRRRPIAAGRGMNKPRYSVRAGSTAGERSSPGRTLDGSNAESNWPLPGRFASCSAWAAPARPWGPEPGRTTVLRRAPWAQGGLAGDLVARAGVNITFGASVLRMARGPSTAFDHTMQHLQRPWLTAAGSAAGSRCPAFQVRQRGCQVEGEWWWTIGCFPALPRVPTASAECTDLVERNMVDVSVNRRPWDTARVTGGPAGAAS